MAMFIPGFAFALYPAFQVPFAFLMAVFMIYDFVKHRKELKKQDYIIMVITIIAIIGLILYFIKTAWPDMVTMMSTVYPGSRFETGGSYTINRFIEYFTNIFLPYTNEILNQSELSSYIYPFIGVITIIIASLKTEKEKSAKEKLKGNGLLVALISLFVFYLLWEFVGFNKILAQVTFMYFSPVERTHVVLGIVGTIITIMLLKKTSQNKNKMFTKLQATIISLIVVLVSYVLLKNSEYKEFFTFIKLEMLFVMLFSMTYFYIRANKRAFCYTMCIIAILAGALVNPIARGTKVLYQTEISKQICEIKQEDKEALWIGRYNWSGQYLLANGVKVLNGVNTYPNFNWLNKVDPDGIYNEVYNRYAHISIILGNKTEFILQTQDCYQAELTYQNVKDLGIKYYFTNEEETQDIINRFKLEIKYSNPEKAQYIYIIN